MFNRYNPIIDSDSYKVSHYKQFPTGTTSVYSYGESRGGLYPETVFFGLQYYLKRYLSTQITMDMINEAERRFNKHFGGISFFNREDWEYIVTKHNGYLPLRIKAVPEGLVVPTRNVLLTIENTDDRCFWLPGYIETAIMRALWYPSTVATISRECKKIIHKYLDETGDVAGLDFKLHDFGSRACTCVEQGAIGGMAHLVNFKGTDTMIALEAAEEYYGEDMAGFSIPAAEHSTITAWGEEFEYEAYENMIKQFGQGALYAVVSDSYNIYEACENIWGTMLVDKVKAAPGMLVIRPDSGVPHEVVRQITEILGKKFGYTTNEKGYKVLNKVRIIQGDGINQDEIVRILEALKIRGWSADNVAFGMGGALLQQCNRDTQKFAIKASSMVRNGRIKDIYKSPITDNGKRSKRGRLKLMNVNGVLETLDIHQPGTDLLQTVWENGKLMVDQMFSDIREKANI